MKIITLSLITAITLALITAIVYFVIQNPIAASPYIAILIMIYCGNGIQVLRASQFIILIEYITILNDIYLVIYYEWLMLIFSIVSIAFARMALKSSSSAVYAYCAFSLGYFSLGIEYIIISNGFLDFIYYPIIYVLLFFLIYAVCHDRMDNIKC